MSNFFKASIKFSILLFFKILTNKMVIRKRIRNKLNKEILSVRKKTYLKYINIIKLNGLNNWYKRVINILNSFLVST